MSSVCEHDSRCYSHTQLLHIHFSKKKPKNMCTGFRGAVQHIRAKSVVVVVFFSCSKAEQGHKVTVASFIPINLCAPVAYIDLEVKVAKVGDVARGIRNPSENFYETADAPENAKSDLRKHFGFLVWFPCVKWERRKGEMTKRKYADTAGL